MIEVNIIKSAVQTKSMLSPKRILHAGRLPVAGVSPLRFIPWLNTLLVVLLAWSLAQFTWRLVPSDTGGSAIVVQPVNASSAKNTGAKPVDLQQVAALHLFGDAARAPAEQVEAPVSAPETALNLTLKGLIAVDNQEQALAIIAQGSGDEQAYRVGDSVPGGAKLHEILADRVILQRGGRFETLTLPKEKVTDGADNTPPRSPVTSRPPRPGLTPNGRYGPGAQQLKAMRERLLKNPQEAMQMINAQPVMDGGQMKGYRVTPGRDRRLFSSVGLRPGDIVTSVNGIPLSDPAQMGQLFDQLTSARPLDVTVERGGRQSHLSLDLQENV